MTLSHLGPYIALVLYSFIGIRIILYFCRYLSISSVCLLSIGRDTNTDIVLYSDTAVNLICFGSSFGHGVRKDIIGRIEAFLQTATIFLLVFMRTVVSDEVITVGIKTVIELVVVLFIMVILMESVLSGVLSLLPALSAAVPYSSTYVLAACCPVQVRDVELWSY